jgi:hypothetical protein
MELKSMRSAVAFLVVAVCGLAAGAEAQTRVYKVDPEAGRNTFSAVFEAPLGERINAVSSAVGCKLTVDDAAHTASGSCKVALESIKVDAEPTKTEHFQQWSTNKKIKPSRCDYAAELEDVKFSDTLAADKKVPFEGQIAFQVCGRGREGGDREKVTGTVTQMDDGTLLVKAVIKGFNRENYGVSPKNTAGWLARVQQLAPVVSATGDIEINVFATRESK